MEEPSTTRFADEGFLAHWRGREFMVQGHGVDNSSGLLMFKAVVDRDKGDEVIQLGNKQGLSLEATFDPEHADLVMIEAIGLLASVERLAQDLAALGYQRLAEPK